jgi:hypothetical protein
MVKSTAFVRCDEVRSGFRRPECREVRCNSGKGVFRKVVRKTAWGDLPVGMTTGQPEDHHLSRRNQSRGGVERILNEWPMGIMKSIITIRTPPGR